MDALKSKTLANCTQAVRKAAQHVPNEDMAKALRGVAATASVRDALNCLVAAVRLLDTDLMQASAQHSPCSASLLSALADGYVLTNTSRDSFGRSHHGTHLPMS